jgi:hypothetical protein
VLTASTAAVRNDGGCADTNVNSADFSLVAPTTLHNSATPVHVCSCN